MTPLEEGLSFVPFFWIKSIWIEITQVNRLGKSVHHLLAPLSNILKILELSGHYIELLLEI